jgi:[ribosomal protein S18]-alanine N-acetyltransferase
MSAVRIRPMGASDLDAVLAMERETPEAPHWKPSDYETSLRPQRNSPLRHAAFVAESDDTAMGHGVQGFVIGRLLLDGEQNACQLESIVVGGTVRRKGVGRLLLQTLARWAESQGARRLELEVRVSNVAAIRLYENSGMVREGLRRRYYAAPEEDAALMGRKLVSAPGGSGKVNGKTG